MREISRTAEKIDKKNSAEEKTNLTPTPPNPTGGGVMGKHLKVTKHKVLKSISGMQLSWSFVGREDMYGRDGLHLSGKGSAVLAEGLSGAVASGLGKVRYLN